MLIFLFGCIHSIYYSAVSIWESEMKHNLHPEDFPFSGRELNALSEKANLNCCVGIEFSSLHNPNGAIQ